MNWQLFRREEAEAEPTGGPVGLYWDERTMLWRNWEQDQANARAAEQGLVKEQVHHHPPAFLPWSPDGD